MIFVTVGSQLPFDRLVGAVDRWAARTGRRDVFAQVGDTSNPPSHVEWARDLAPDEFAQKIAEADIVIGHAGTGTIMAALTAGTPVVVLARREHLGETRNDHQVATIERFRSFDGFFGTDDTAEVGRLVDEALASSGSNVALARHASGPLVDRLREFLDTHLR